MWVIEPKEAWPKETQIVGTNIWFCLVLPSITIGGCRDALTLVEESLLRLIFRTSGLQFYCRYCLHLCKACGQSPKPVEVSNQVMKTKVPKRLSQSPSLSFPSPKPVVIKHFHIQVALGPSNAARMFDDWHCWVQVRWVRWVHLSLMALWPVVPNAWFGRVTSGRRMEQYSIQSVATL